MAVTFYIANDVSEALKATEALDLEEELDAFFYEHQDMLGQGGEILVELDPYGTKILNHDEMVALIQLCNRIPDLFVDPEVREFASQFLQLCEKALQQEKTIVALGD